MRKYRKTFLAAPFFAMALLTAALLLSAALLVSCDYFLDFFNTMGNPEEDPFGTLEPNTFYAQNMKTGKYYKVPAGIIYTGEHCVIWAEEGSIITNAKEIAEEYDEVISPRIVGAFSMEPFYDNTAKKEFADILDYANWRTGGTDGKLTILLLDIQDGFKNPYTDSYVAGYFFSGDFWSKGVIGRTGHYSNGRDMIYIDTYPGLQNLDQAYSTFAHELQHLISYATTRQMNKRLMDTWIDEGLSSQAEHIYLGTHPTERCDWFLSDKNGTIAKGNNFFVWDNYQAQGRAILDDYATVYMFFRWLYLQAGNDDIFRDIVTSAGYDHSMIVNLAEEINPDWDSWEKVLKAWMIANYYPADTIYGYKGDDDLHKYIVPKFTSGTSILLYPGEGVYSKIITSFTPQAGGGSNIRYVGMNGSSFPYGQSGQSYTGEALLTFNANTNKAALQETGQLTGISLPLSVPMAASVQKTEFSGPYVLDARDVLGREWDRELPVFSEPFFQRAEQ